MVELFYFNNRKIIQDEIFFLMYKFKHSYEELLNLPTDLRKEYISFINTIIKEENKQQ